jgi:hypothetical protein
MLLERVAHGEVSFTFEPNARGKTKLVRSTTSGAQQPKYHALALKGLLAEAVNGTPGHAGPPTTTVSFTLTAAGRGEMGIHHEHKPNVNWHPAPTEADMERDGIE